MEVFRPCTRNNNFGDCCPKPPDPFIEYDGVFFLYDVTCPEDREEGEDCPFVLYPFPNEDSPNSGETTGSIGDITESIGFYNSDGTDGQYSKTNINRIGHSPTATCYLKVWVKVFVQDTDGSSPPQELSDFDYEWTGSGRPCIQDSSKSWLDEENRISESINWDIDVGQPAKGTSRQALVYTKYSIIKGYEPPWPEGVE
jgi:hypothetical protein